MNYRLYKPEDFGALYAIEEACFQPPYRFGRGTMRRLVKDANAVTWIAEDDWHMAGFAIVEWSEIAGSRLAYIQTIEVAAEDRGRGVGGELLRRMEGSAKAAGAEGIWLHVDEENAGSIRLYEAHDYLRAGREDNYYPRSRAALIYAKALSPSGTR